ncbi:hypothetical protein [Mycolicibacterium palauense]|uniref:hypothetical protein n=1 Tax=Mycolicibacterium palauense TaxID=2034511 RepID=UPI0011455CA7|nr:hypothetical protein [Mycolicibacterium palauense]
MRVLIESDPEFVSSVTVEFEADPGAAVTPTEPATDLTEQRFGLAEAAAIIVIVKGVFEIIEVVKRVVRRSKKKQTLRLKSALATVVVEISPDVTAEELQDLLAPLTQLP